MKSIIKRYLVFVLGLYFLAAGVVLIVRSALGTTPISSINYVMSLNTPLTLGTCTFIINMLLIVGQFWLIRGRGSRQDVMEILLQIPFSFIFSAFIDFNMVLASDIHPVNYAASIGLLLVTFLIAVFFSGKVYRIGILMHGTKYSWKDIWKWLKY